MKNAAFDWYQATVQTTPETVVSWFKQVWPDAIVRPAKPKNGSSDCVQVCLGDSVVCSAIWGGGMEGYGVNVWSSGRDAIFFAEQFRRRFPQHRVTRADVAIDFEGIGAWDWMSGKCLELADKHRLVVDHQGDYHRGERGRSLYIGSKQSVIRAVAYEKGKQIPEIGMPNLVRLEIRAKPKDAKSGEILATMTPMAIYGCSSWTRELGGYLTSSEQFKRVVIGTRWNKSDRQKAINAVIKQYGGIFGEMCSELGSWSDFGEEIGRLVLEAAEAKQRLVEDTKKVSRGQSIKPQEKTPQEAAETV